MRVLLIVVVSTFGYLLFLLAIAFFGSFLLTSLAPRLRTARSRSDPGAAARIRGLMRRMARPTLMLAPTRSPGFSKLGGEPDMPVGAVWPASDRGPTAFVAQLDLAAIRLAGGPDWLPMAGALYVFNDDQRYGFADHVQVLFRPDGPRERLSAPAALGPRQRFAERRVGFLPMTSIPSLDWLGVDVRDVDLSEEELIDLAAAPDAEFGDELQHRIGGYPGEIQELQMAIECERLARGLPPADPGAEVTQTIARAARSWRLLLQVDSDPALRMNWGDGGRLYVFIREQHAREGDFTKAVSLSQTY